MKQTMFYSYVEFWGMVVMELQSVAKQVFDQVPSIDVQDVSFRIC